MWDICVSEKTGFYLEAVGILWGDVCNLKLDSTYHCDFIATFIFVSSSFNS